MLGERFWSKVQKTADGCWLWIAAKTNQGYGWFQLGRSVGPRTAHRLAYEELVGPLPEDLTLDHLCRVRNCVNPAHLEPVTRGENVLRGIGFSAQNKRKTHCPKGHPYEGDNLQRGGGGRRCAACHCADEKERQVRRQAAVLLVAV